MKGKAKKTSGESARGQADLKGLALPSPLGIGSPPPGGLGHWLRIKVMGAHCLHTVLRSAPCAKQSPTQRSQALGRLKDC